MFTRLSPSVCVLLTLALAACGDKDASSDDSASGLPCSTSVPGLILPDGALSGDVPLTLNLSSPDETSANVTLEWSLDGESWSPATVEGSLSDLPVSPEGFPHGPHLGQRGGSGLRRRRGPSAQGGGDLRMWPVAQERRHRPDRAE
ncbi:MAG: hypothetical protein IPI35_06045 [Deltaproteobacteria bacterium]|nr:hypothetical protein [Deltaproteobacteria bacterium]